MGQRGGGAAQELGSFDAPLITVDASRQIHLAQPIRCSQNRYPRGFWMRSAMLYSLSEAHFALAI